MATAALGAASAQTDGDEGEEKNVRSDAFRELARALAHFDQGRLESAQAAARQLVGVLRRAGLLSSGEQS